MILSLEVLDVFDHLIIPLEFLIQPWSEVQIFISKLGFLISLSCILLLPLEMAPWGQIFWCKIMIDSFILVNVSWNLNWSDCADTGPDLLIYASDLFDGLSIDRSLGFEHLDGLVQATLGIWEWIIGLIWRSIGKLIVSPILKPMPLLGLPLLLRVGWITLILYRTYRLAISCKFAFEHVIKSYHLIIIFHIVKYKSKMNKIEYLPPRCRTIDYDKENRRDENNQERRNSRGSKRKPKLMARNKIMQKLFPNYQTI